MSNIEQSDDDAVNTDPNTRFNYLAVDWQRGCIVTLGSCMSLQQARLRATNRGLADAHRQEYWLAAAGDTDARFQLGLDDAAIIVFHPETGEAFEPVLGPKRRVYLRKFIPPKPGKQGD